MKKQIILILILTVLLFQSNIFSDDKELFMGVDIGSSEVRPNIMILMDSSGSMNCPIYYPQLGFDKEPGGGDDGFDPNIIYTGGGDTGISELYQTQWYGRWVHGGSAYVKDTGELNNFWTGCYDGDGSLDNFQVGGNAPNFRVGDKVMFRDTSAPYNYALATLVRLYEKDGNNWFELSDIEGGPITVNGGHFQQAPTGEDWHPAIVRLYGTTEDSGEGVWWNYIPNYTKWMFIHATDAHRSAISHFSEFGTFNLNINPPPMEPNDMTNATWLEDPDNKEWVDWWLSDCVSPTDKTRKKFRYTRIQVAREVICKVGWTYQLAAKLGLTKFDGSDGGDVIEGLNDMSDEASFVTFRNSVSGIEAGGSTPLAEALADIWKYYKPSGSVHTYWPVETEIANGAQFNYSNPVGPVDWWCQKNYAVVVTDGESTSDRFTGDGRFDGSIFKTPAKRLPDWDGWEDGWGDTDDKDVSSGLPENLTDPNYCPNYSCWQTYSGSDYLDDVAYFLAHQDMYPDEVIVGGTDKGFGDDPETGWPGDQVINTYTIGFTIDNDLLKETAINGLGEYYNASSYEDLLEAFKSIITSILLRDFAFSAITAPKKTTTVGEDDVNMSYVGYFLPSSSKSVWEGHLQAKELQELWGFDFDESGDINLVSETKKTEEECITEWGEGCVRILNLSTNDSWDAAIKLDLRETDRDIFYLDTDSSIKSFAAINAADSGKQAMFGAGTTEEEVNTIKEKISEKVFADVFHSDIAYVGAPLPGKRYLNNINPPESAIDSTKLFYQYYLDKADRKPMVFVGTNDGVLHMIDGRPTYGGKEEWGFVPDEVLPSVKKIFLGNEHIYTVDGRIHPNDIFYRKSGATDDLTWKTILCFGLRAGGKTFYTLDVSDVTTQPVFLWKFKDADYSGESWSKPIIRQIITLDPNDSTNTIHRWAVFLTAGFAFNDENKNDPRGKAIFVIDASTGELIWMIAYKSDGEEDNLATDHIDTLTIGGVENKHYTKLDEFNFSVPSAITVIDKNNDGLSDTIYFGNRGGHLYKVDIGNANQENWKTYLLYKQIDSTLDVKYEAVITAIDLADPDFPILKLGNTKLNAKYVGYNIMGKDEDVPNYAFGNVMKVDGFYVTVEQTSSTPFEVDQTVTVKAYDPIYLNPAVFYDTCSKLWVSFGTGDRDRPRTNPNSGKFVVINDNNTYNLQLDTNIYDITDGAVLSQVTENETVYNKTNNDVSISFNGFYYKFTDDGEKLFDPEPIVLPDEYSNPHIVFNTYIPPVTEVSVKENPCNGVSEGSMVLYDIKLSNCGNPDLDVEITDTKGRIAGGGMYGGEYVTYIGEGEVGSIPPLQRVGSQKLPYPGGVIFWKEKKR